MVHLDYRVEKGVEAFFVRIEHKVMIPLWKENKIYHHAEMKRNFGFGKGFKQRHLLAIGRINNACGTKKIQDFKWKI